LRHPPSAGHRRRVAVTPDLIYGLPSGGCGAPAVAVITSPGMCLTRPTG